ncbi:aldo/keto reductase [Zavarzinia compransoris]|uniref:aldo/keto reductase n=1 Tax=Zavarzinia marina TaxID=2911065 RepID=UPI001F425E97|nr:aldo/keto reductase [Zavarzinia marina]MCF4165467.1 aldo/keto reductase [Zavarzinia marina]
MEHRSLGPSGPAVSAIGLGCMGMSEFYGPRSDDSSLETLAAALDAGIDFFDTADTYGHGHNEALLGRFLKGRRDRVVIATKFGIVRAPGAYERRIDNSPAHVAAACDASLKRLGVETIDLYYAHRIDPARPIEETVGAMARLVEAGKVRHLGLSEVSAATLRRAAAVHPIAAVQSEYSLWTRDPEADGVMDACRDLGTAFVAYSPLGRAFLTGTLRRPDDLAADDVRRALPRFQDAAMARNLDLAAGLAALATARAVTPAQMALAWLLAKQPHAIAIPGTTKAARARENAAASAIVLTGEEMAALDALFPLGAATGARYTPEGMKGVGS